MKKFLLTFLWIISTTCLLQAEPEIAVSSVHAPSKASFAQPFALQYQITHTPGYEVSVEEKSLSPDFEITQAAFARQSPTSGLYDFTAVPFALGKSTFTVTFVLTQQDTPAASAGNEHALEITPVKTFNDKKLREVRPARVPPSWAVWMLMVLFILALGYALYCWYQRRQEQALRVRSQEDTRPNDEIALSKIEALLQSGLWERKAYKLFYITLTDILREYLWRQFHTDTSADTSAEVLRRVKNIPLMQPLLVPLKDFLSSGDLVKFAKAQPTEQIRNKDIQILREIVHETTPAPTEEKPS